MTIANAPPTDWLSWCRYCEMPKRDSLKYCGDECRKKGAAARRLAKKDPDTLAVVTARDARCEAKETSCGFLRFRDERRKQAEQDLLQAEQDKERANKTRKEFTAAWRKKVLPELMHWQAGLCGICEEPLGGGKPQIDHIVPVSRGGGNEFDNLQAVHPACNNSKQNLTGKLAKYEVRDGIREVEYADLRGENHSHINLYGADMFNADLRGAILVSANLINASLSGANLAGANLTGALMQYAGLGGANLTSATMARARAQYAWFDRANLTAACLTDADLHDANLRRVDLRQADLRGADLSGANLERANLQYADLRDANLSGASLCFANLADAIMDGALVEDADFQGVRIDSVNLRGVVFHAPPKPNLYRPLPDSCDVCGNSAISHFFSKTLCSPCADVFYPNRPKRYKPEPKIGTQASRNGVRVVLAPA